MNDNNDDELLLFFIIFHWNNDHIWEIGVPYSDFFNVGMENIVEMEKIRILCHLGYIFTAIIFFKLGKLAVILVLYFYASKNFVTSDQNALWIGIKCELLPDGYYFTIRLVFYPKPSNTPM